MPSDYLLRQHSIRNKVKPDKDYGIDSVTRDDSTIPTQFQETWRKKQELLHLTSIFISRQIS